MAGVVIGVAAALLACAVAVPFLLLDRSRVLKAANDDLAADVMAASSLVERTLGSLNFYVQLRLQQDSCLSYDVKRCYTALTARESPFADVLEGLSNFGLVGADGTILGSFNPAAVGVNVADRRYFSVHHDDPRSQMVVLPPIVSRVSPYRWQVPISWPWRGAGDQDGRLVVTATDWRQFAPQLSQLISMSGERLAIVDQADVVYAVDNASWPADRKDPPRPVELAGFARGTVVPGSGNLLHSTAIGTTSLFVVAAVSRAAVLQGFYNRVLSAGLLITVLASAIGRLVANLHRARGALQASAAQAEAARAAAVQADRAKSTFLATMSHELRTPLTAVVGLADLLARESLGGVAHGYVRSIRRSGRQLVAVVNDILDFQRIGAGGLSLELVDFSLHELLGEIESMMRPAAVERGLLLMVEADPATDMLRGDPMRLKQILFNLVGNAIKFTTAGQVTLRAKPHRGSTGGPAGGCWCRFEVEDTGPGLTAVQAAKLFQPFVQADDGVSRRHGGSGLGLAISRGLAELMGGSIGLESEPGRGSLFWVELPYAAAQRVDVAEAAEPVFVALPPMDVLLADDAPLTRELVADMLGRFGHRVHPTADGQELLDAAARRRFDLLLIDIQMPVLDGDEALRLLRAGHGPNRSTPAIALTANVLADDQQRFLASGFDRCLAKPISWDRLWEAARELRSSVAAPPGAPIAPQGDTIDWTFVEGNLGGVGDGQLRDWLARCLAEAQQLLASLEAGIQPSEGRRLAHRLKGQARMLGMAALGDAAQAIETNFGGEGSDRPRLDRLEASILASRSAVDARATQRGNAYA